MTIENVLSGKRVLDFGRFIAGPYCAALLGHLGAEVIRIERPGGSEDRTLAPVTEQGDGGLFMQMNSNKLGMTLNISQPAGRSIVKQLVATADVVIANFPPKTLQALELDYESLKAIRPDIILVTNNAFGSSGPYANRVGFDGVAQAMSGAAYYSGLPGRPAKAAVQYVDYSTALAATVGTLAALMMRERTGEGQVVETSLLATALTLVNSSLIEQAVVDANRLPTGNQSQLTAPADLFATSDGFIIVQVVGPYIYKRWATLMGEPEWLSDARFKDDESRGTYREAICARMARWCEARTTEEALAELEVARIPTGPVLSFQEALDHPMVQALGHLEPINYPGAPRPVPVAKPPFTLSGTPTVPQQRAPLTGEHTDDILAQLGYNGDEIAQLRETEIV